MAFLPFLGICQTHSCPNSCVESIPTLSNTKTRVNTMLGCCKYLIKCLRGIYADCVSFLFRYNLILIIQILGIRSRYASCLGYTIRRRVYVCHYDNENLYCIFFVFVHIKCVPISDGISFHKDVSKQITDGHHINRACKKSKGFLDISACLSNGLIRPSGNLSRKKVS